MARVRVNKASNAGPSPELWELYDKSKTDPRNHLSITTREDAPDRRFALIQSDLCLHDRLLHQREEVAQPEEAAEVAFELLV